MVRPVCDIATAGHPVVIHPTAMANGCRHALSGNDIASCSRLVGMSGNDMHCGYTNGPHVPTRAYHVFPWMPTSFQR